MSMIIPPVKTTRPISLVPHYVDPVSDGRMRHLVVPAAVMGDRPMDLESLWVREGFTINDRQPARKAEISIRYAGDGRSYRRPWPRAIPRPVSGVRDAGQMPVTLSRLTLLIESVRVCNIGDVTEDEAMTAGLFYEGDGASVIGYPFIRAFGEYREALAWMIAQVHSLTSGVDPVQPLAVVKFRSLARNISQVAIGAVA